MLSINELLQIKETQQAKNNFKEPKPLYGASAEYKKYLNTSKFKLVVYYHKNKFGNYYTQFEKDANKNRRYIPSIDFEFKNGFNYQNHEAGFLKLLNYVYDKATLIDKCFLILNDYTTETEQTIIKFNCKHFNLSQYVQPIFKTYKGNILFSHLEGQPLRIDKMRENFIK